jgi:hypothetical protein
MRIIHLQYFNDADSKYLFVIKKDDVSWFICLEQGLGLPQYITIQGKVSKYNKMSDVTIGESFEILTELLNH